MQSDLRDAYERGQADARARRKRHPFLMTLMFLAAAVGLAVIVLALMNGSFQGAGDVVDANLATAADTARPVVSDAAAEASQALREATTPDPAPPAVAPEPPPAPR